MLLGEELFRTERIWDKLYRGTLRFGRRGAAVRAISAVDIAIWDAIGKAYKRLELGDSEYLPAFFAAAAGRERPAS